MIGAKVVTNTRTPGTRCFGYVTMNSSADATKCITNLHRTELHGRIISVERAKSDIGNIGNKQKRTSTSGDSKKNDEEKKPSNSERHKKAKEEEASSTENKSNNKSASASTEKISATDDTTSKKAEPTTDAALKARKSSSRQKDGPKKGSQSRRSRRPVEVDRRDRKRERDREAVLSYRKIREEHERQRQVYFKSASEWKFEICWAFNRLDQQLVLYVKDCMISFTKSQSLVRNQLRCRFIELTVDQCDDMKTHKLFLFTHKKKIMEEIVFFKFHLHDDDVNNFFRW